MATMASDCNNVTEDPDYDWMEVLDNFLVNDEYERNEPSESNGAGHQLHVQHGRNEMSGPHRPQENAPSNGTSSYTRSNNSNGRENFRVPGTGSTCVNSVATNQVIFPGSAPSDPSGIPSTSESNGITTTSSEGITRTVSNTGATGVPGRLGTIDCVRITTSDSTGATTNCSGIITTLDSNQVSTIGTGTEVTAADSTGFSETSPSGVSCTNFTNTTVSQVVITTDSSGVPVTNSSGVPSTDYSGIPDIEKPKTLDDEKVETPVTESSQNDWPGASVYHYPIYFAPYPFYGYWGGQNNNENTSDLNESPDKKIENGSSTEDTQKQIFTYDTTKTVPETCSNVGTGTFNQQNHGSQSDSNFNSVTKKDDTLPSSCEPTNQNPHVTGPVISTGDAPSNAPSTSVISTDKSNIQENLSSTNKLISSTEDGNDAQNLISVDPRSTLYTQHGFSTGLPSNDCADTTEHSPVPSFSTDIRKTQQFRDISHPVPLVPLSSNVSTGISDSNLNRPFTHISNISVPCPILLSNSDVITEENDNGIDKNNLTRADPTQSNKDCSKDRDRTCHTDSSTMASRDDDNLHSSGLEFPEDSGLDGLDIENKQQARSERKRNREKQRRTDVNAQFAALTSLLRRVEAEDLESDAEPEEEDDDSADPGHKSKKRKKCSLSVLGALGQGSPSNRVDLIARTITVMDRLHELSAKRRTEVRKLKKQIKVSKSPEDGAEKVTSIPAQVHSNPNSQMMPMAQSSMMMSPGKDGQQQPFMMMVPMVMGADGTPQSGGSMPNCPMPPMQFMGQNCYPMQGGQGQQVKMPPQGMSMMPPGMYPGQQQPGNARPGASPNPGQSHMPQMMQMYGGMNPTRMMPPQNSSRPHVPNQNSAPQQNQSNQARQQQQKKASNGGNLAHCA